MKIKHFFKAFTTVLISTALAVSANAAFEKTNTYTEGMFTDVPSNAWYASEVKNAYELGFMNGQSDTLMSPDGTMTVAQGITVASRVHAIYNGKTIAEKQGGKWYDMYVEYAVENGICTKDDFNNLDRNIRRYEMACLFANALPESYFAAKNDISSIPDVNPSEEYADELLMLYKAGVVLGSDEYGTFHPNNPIKRCEAAAIINRAALAENRLTGTLSALPQYNEAYYLIDNAELMYMQRGNKQVLASSWNYDNRCDGNVNTTGQTSHNIADSSTEGYVAINRAFEPQSRGLVTYRAAFTFVDGKNGARIYFENSKGENIFEIYTKDGLFYAKTFKDNVNTNAVLDESKDVVLRVDFDLDNAKATVFVNEKNVANVSLYDFGDMAKIFYSTTDEDILAITPLSTVLYANYYVNEGFTNENSPSDWTGNVATEHLVDSMDSYSLAMDKTGKANKSFRKLSGKVVFESYVYMPSDLDSAYVSLNNGTNEAVRVNFVGSEISTGNIKHNFKNHIWQCIYVEADTTSSKAKLYINGKLKGEVPFTADSFDGITLCCDKKASSEKVYFDDIKVYNVYDYVDYCPVPDKAESDDYVLIMSVCSLWREGTHYGWDFVSPYDECSPLLGYYDEGIPETSDWEIKIMAEHGIDAMQYCWYTGSSDFSAPIKHPRLYWALHDGYFHAKYSDMVGFCILFENQNFKNGAKLTLEEFKEYIWDYWTEWYFCDERYLRVDNKAVLQWFRSDLIYTMFDDPKAVVDFMREDIKNYGYDGLIFLACGDGSSATQAQKYAETGFDGIGCYGWDANSSRPEYLRSVNKTAMNITQKLPTYSYLPCVASGRNIIGWENERTAMSTPEQHAEVLSDYKTLLKEQQSVKGDGWMSKMLYFSTWNEYGEGHWLAPSGLNGFGYADEWRKAFTEAPVIHDDILPTINQQKRISRLYNNTRQPIRPWLEVEVENENVEQSVLIKEFTFKNASDIAGWSGSRISISQKDGVMHVDCLDGNPILRSPLGQNIKASDVEKIVVRAKLPTAAKVNFYFTTESDRTENAEKGIGAIADKENEFIDIVFDTTKCAAWSGNIYMLRFNLLNAEGSYDVESIRLYGKNSQKEKVKTENAITIDGVALDIPDYYRTNENGEQYVALDPSTGIFSASNMYHEWNRFEGTLFIKTHNDVEFFFTKGSNKVLVNGKEQTLAKAFDTYDHVPVVPYKWLLKQAGISYTEKSQMGLDVSIRGYNFAEIAANRKKGEYEFEIVGDTEKWVVRNASASFKNGNLVLAPTLVPTTQKYDAFILQEVYDFDADEFNTLTVRLKCEPETADEKIAFYFATSSEPVLSESKTVRATVANGKDDGDGYRIYTLDLTSNPSWKASITQIRFDLPSENGKYSIDYLRFSKEEKETASLAEEKTTVVYGIDFTKGASSIGSMNILATGAVGSFADGHYVLTTAPEGTKDPKFALSSLPEILANSENYDTIRVTVKLPDIINQKAVFYYISEGDSGYSNDRAVVVNHTDCKVVDGYTVIDFDVSKLNKKFTHLRFDPADAYDTFRFKSVEFLKKTENGTSQAPQNIIDSNAAKSYVPKGTKVYSLDFNIGDSSIRDGMKIIATGALGEFSDGHYVLTTSPAGTSDPKFALSPLPEILSNTNNYDKIVVKVLMPEGVTNSAVLFYIQEGETGYSAAKCVKVPITEQKKVGGYNIIEFDTSSLPEKVTHLRFDPADMDETFKFLSVEFYKNQQ